jgi:hypothetical protein
MKALPIILFVIAVCFAVIEYEHGRLHDAVLQNNADRIENIQTPGEAPVARRELRSIRPGPLGVGYRGPARPAPAATTPSPTPKSTDQQVAEAKAGANQDRQTLERSEQNMFDIRLGLTAILLPLCIVIIVVKTRFDGKDRNFAYATVGAVVTFWLHS